MLFIQQLLKLDNS